MRSEISVKMKSKTRIKESENQTVVSHTIFLKLFFDKFLVISH